MNYYQDIRLLPDAETNLGFLWHKVFQQIHIALVEYKIGENQSAIGLSIPGYKLPEKGEKEFPLGDIIRLFANTEAELETLGLTQWLIRLEDYAQIKTIKPIPEVTQYACFTRRHIKSQKQIAAKTKKMAEYQAIETGEPIETCLEKLSESAPCGICNLPFIHAKSLSGNAETSDGFRLFIEQKLLDEPKSGYFTCYGLSDKSEEKQATVPWF
ncbi:type I-F CRISPR-associated endoribonuclease Cas6/Csy4 [Teredinibacter sp. KSP-S5-2]|uniref:type I-F CRISPR-associated endoribonuclease Cas6/Csy4 n=1 Tax=Teredinibacter sp. KSP-S5-2 TaxID=3034506 RepID=UPI002934B4F5|nr:type I-F CRISPR-associated endoribonuclease Cas6/Csy4 [Teredinibacter sp. KSP-S5-2]WNO08315.1 type I-F CRISPR-associated endoribonuclease Cas6/Csy4 [Teredinibacter sp. KSP-S5-2]